MPIIRRVGRVLAVVCCVAVMLGGGPVGRAQEAKPDLAAIKTYLLAKLDDLTESTEALQSAATTYYERAKAASFDYDTLAKDADAIKALLVAKAAWMEASPLYEQIEGIVAGVPSLAEFDVILDAGSSAADDPDSAVPFDLTLPDGRVLARPGNLFGLLESTLWGTRPDFVGKTEVDLDADGKIAFGELLPEANMVKGGADTFAGFVADLNKAAKAWEPTVSDAFTALVVMTPTMSEYFESWKLSRFVLGEASTQSDFVVISRLADIQDILSGLEVVHQGLSPLIAGTDAARDRQIGAGLRDLKQYVAELYAQEKDGKRFTPEEADLFGSEAQERAQAIAAQIAQVAAQLGVTLPE